MNTVHILNKSRTLALYEHKLLDREGGQMTILFSFCGKAVDMAHYYRNGHTVIGVESAARTQ